MFYELAAPTWGPEEIAAIERVVASGRFTMGETVAAFERAFADHHGMKHAVMVNSGSSANLVSVAALFYKQDRPLQRGDEVIVPAISWATTYHPLQQYGLKLVFVDVELDTLNMDASRLEQALSPRTRAIVAVSILGNPAALDVIRRFADDHGLYLIEDNCESMDAELAGRKTGTFGHLNTFSFFFSHHISTMEGGMVLTDDTELYHLTRSMRAHGWTRDLPADSPVFRRGTDDHYEAYRFILPGYNVRPLELEGAIGLEQLKKLPGFTAARRRNLALFRDRFAGDERFIIQREHGKSSCFSFTIILNPARNPDRRAVFAAMAEADIGFRIITGGCFLRHDVIRHYDYRVAGGVENANLAHDLGFFVGNHPFDLTAQIERLHAVLDRACP
ncbi:DegT/DnrJ/EryC1/StrS family aminotransferase [Azospirillum halopraeferens]|uniref:DegT/DnrJ/EryC1/StrS family aminotransferase n=1 Tax=Azospirillum halopraeferens TaxID=34010 RepID=UPI00040DB923|nr:DegT/DnrJ/EryC1/StrS family aminotransferase [Azospirillum halopraeferens]